MGCDTTARRGWRRVLAGATLLLAAVAPARPQGLPGAALAREFTVYLEDRRIGTHRFEVTAQGAAGMATVVSTAEFQVKILGACRTDAS